jgi:hypothetical protein
VYYSEKNPEKFQKINDGVCRTIILEVMEELKIVIVSLEIEKLLEDYAYVFKKPKGLLPARKFDHKIPFKLGV